MLTGVDKFQLRCSIKCVEAQKALNAAESDEKVSQCYAELEALASCAEHHLAGLKAAKTRFSALVD